MLRLKIFIIAIFISSTTSLACSDLTVTKSGSSSLDTLYYWGDTLAVYGKFNGIGSPYFHFSPKPVSIIPKKRLVKIGSISKTDAMFLVNGRVEKKLPHFLVVISNKANQIYLK